MRGTPVFTHQDGGPVHRRDLRRWLRAAQRHANVKVTEGPHILRHTFCSHLAMRGAPAKSIQELAGHSNLTTTYRYMHLSPAAREGAIRLLNAREGAEGADFGELGETERAAE
jgi:site-specific recombinase XerD